MCGHGAAVFREKEAIIASHVFKIILILVLLWVGEQTETCSDGP